MQNVATVCATTTIHIKSLAQTTQLAEKMMNACKPPCVIYLQGQLGAGKTTFVRGLLTAMGLTGRVKSPTFTLVEPYHLHDIDVYHFDLYRLTEACELHQIGIDDYITQTSICLIEWPQKGGDYLPMPDLVCEIVQHQTDEQQRQFILTAHSTIGMTLLTQVTRTWAQEQL